MPPQERRPVPQGSSPQAAGSRRTFEVVGFAGVCWFLFTSLTWFDIHGWRGLGLALGLAVLLVGAGRLVVRKIAAATELERRDGRASRGGNRAERRERARRLK